MSTRSIIMVTGGDATWSPAKQTIRIYKHNDGYPNDNLQHIINAINKTNEVLEKWKSFGEQRTVVPAICFAHAFMASTLTWTGFAAEIDTEDNNPHNPGLAIFDDTLKAAHYGDRGDLEWIYAVDVSAKTLKVYHYGYALPETHLKHGTVDPTIYAKQLKKEFQNESKAEILGLCLEIEGLGWKINPEKKKISFQLYHENQMVKVKQVAGSFNVTVDGHEVTTVHPDLVSMVLGSIKNGFAAPLLDWLEERTY